MKIFYSATTGGFYFDLIHGDAVPEDVKQISNDLYQSLKGKDVIADADGMPMLRPPPKYFYSASSGCFFVDRSYGEVAMPDDVKEVSEEIYSSLHGRDVVADANGMPMLRPPPKYFYSAHEGGFYIDAIHGAAMPSDAKEITSETYGALIGRDVVADAQGLPMLRPATVPTPADEREALKAAATAKRYELETGGIDLPNGMRLDTTREDQNAVANAIALADIAGVTSVDFKAASGWLAITIPELKQIGAAIGLHKQACYSAERAHHEAIDQLPDAGLDAYDLEAGWTVDAIPANPPAPD